MYAIEMRDRAVDPDLRKAGIDAACAARAAVLRYIMPSAFGSQIDSAGQ
jgi:hypothetical protein